MDAVDGGDEEETVGGEPDGLGGLEIAGWAEVEEFGAVVAVADDGGSRGSDDGEKGVVGAKGGDGFAEVGLGPAGENGPVAGVPEAAFGSSDGAEAGAIGADHEKDGLVVAEGAGFGGRLGAPEPGVVAVAVRADQGVASGREEHESVGPGFEGGGAGGGWIAIGPEVEVGGLGGFALLTISADEPITGGGVISG